MKKVTELKPEDSGKKFTAIIRGKDTKGKILYEDKTYYLCQNDLCGSSGSTLLGYKYSWSVGIGTKEKLRINDTINLQIEETTTKSDIKWVYVSDESEADALRCQKKRLLIHHDPLLRMPYICVVETDTEDYLNGVARVSMNPWTYAVPVPEKQWKPIRVSLNTEHTAEVLENSVKVGCQTFDFRVIKKLYDAVIQAEEFNKE